MQTAQMFIVIPAFNEQRTVDGIVREVKKKFSNVVVVDDGSVDETGRVAAEAGATVVTHLINRGQGAALKTGIDFALARGAEVIVTFDSDGQHRVEDIAALASPILEQGFDVVLGSRFLRNDNEVPTVRKLTLKLGVMFTRIVSRIRVTDTHNGLRAFSRRAGELMVLHEDRMAHASEILDEISRLGLRYCEVPTRVVYTEYSLQKGQRNTAAPRIALEFLLGKWQKRK